MDDQTASAQNKDTLYESTDAFLQRNEGALPPPPPRRIREEDEVLDLPKARRDGRIGLSTLSVLQLQKLSESLRDNLIYEMLPTQRAARCALRLKYVVAYLRSKVPMTATEEVFFNNKHNCKTLTKLADAALVCIAQGESIRFKSSLIHATEGMRWARAASRFVEDDE